MELEKNTLESEFLLQKFIKSLSVSVSICLTVVGSVGAFHRLFRILSRERLELRSPSAWDRRA